jgi:hypothetical protein
MNSGKHAVLGGCFVLGLVFILSPVISGGCSSATPSTISIPPSQINTITTFPVPLISLPPDGSTVTSLHPAFSWSPIDDAIKYEFQLSTSSTFDTTIFIITPTAANTVTPSGIVLEAGTRYFWRVRTLQPAQSDWSVAASFFVAR